MATISDGTILLILSQIATYWVLYRNNTRVYRLIGSGLMILIGFSAVMIEDTVPAFIFLGASLIIGMIQIIKDVTSLT